MIDPISHHVPTNSQVASRVHCALVGRARQHSLMNTALQCYVTKVCRSDETTHSFYAGYAGGWWRRGIITRRHGQINAQRN